MIAHVFWIGPCCWFIICFFGSLFSCSVFCAAFCVGELDLFLPTTCRTAACSNLQRAARVKKQKNTNDGSSEWLQHDPTRTIDAECERKSLARFLCHFQWSLCLSNHAGIIWLADLRNLKNLSMRPELCSDKIDLQTRTLFQNSIKWPATRPCLYPSSGLLVEQNKRTVFDRQARVVLKSACRWPLKP